MAEDDKDPFTTFIDQMKELGGSPPLDTATMALAMDQAREEGFRSWLGEGSRNLYDECTAARIALVDATIKVTLAASHGEYAHNFVRLKAAVFAFERLGHEFIEFKRLRVQWLERQAVPFKVVMNPPGRR